MKRLTSLAAVALIALPLASCSTDDETATSTPAAEMTTDEMATAEMADITIEDGWVKAADEDEMTAAFGTLTNHSDADIEIVSIATDLANNPQLHETVVDTSGASEMSQVEGFVIPAEGTHVLEPGGDHLMLMDLTGEIESGTSATLELTTAEGDLFEIELPVREFTGAEESYDEGQSDMDMDDSDMDHSDDDHSEHDHSEETTDQ